MAINGDQVELRTRDNLPPSFQGAFSDTILDDIDCGRLLYVPSSNTFIRREEVQNPPPQPDGCGGPSFIADKDTGEQVQVEAQVLNRDSLPEEFEGRMGENLLELIDCGDLLYLPSLKVWKPRELITNPPPRPSECYESPIEEVTLDSTTDTIVVNDGDLTSSSTPDVTSTVQQNSIDNTSGISDSGSTSETQGFCGTEERVSTHTCNSLHPSTSIDLSGNVGVVWHDTRDGTHDIYFRTLASKISQKEALEALVARIGKTGRTINLDCDPVSELGLTGDDLKIFDAIRRCNEKDTSSGVAVRGENGQLAVNVIARSMVLSTEDEGIDFFAAGIQPGSLLRIETGANSNLQVSVNAVVGTGSLDLAFIDGATTDSGFSFSILENPTFSLTSCETRLTCSEFTSVFPDVVVDRDGRFHVVYQSDNTGTNQLYYIQMAPRSVGIKDNCLDGPPINLSGGFGEVPEGTPGSITFTDNTDSNNPVNKGFMTTGQTGDFFSFGNRFLVPTVPNGSTFQLSKNGTHKLFRDFATPGIGGKWTGITSASDRSAWNAQIANLGSNASPDVVFGDNHPIADEGDFGTRFNLKNVAIMVQTPPTAGVSIRTISLPISPKCAPQGPSGVINLREQDLVRTPKRPVPPSFSDPVDISQLLSGPNVSIDESTPSRFTIEGDAGGTIFTNIMSENARGELSRLVFRKDDEGDEIKFILGQQACGDVPCGVTVPSNVIELPPTLQYKLTLQVWRGSDYRIDASQIASAQMGATLVFEKEFKFDQSSDITTFVFDQGELVLPAGSVVFFVPIAGDNTEFTIEGVGIGNSVWLTDSDGSFTNYNTTPFSLKPFSGLNVPIYYDGLLLFGQEDITKLTSDLSLTIITRTATTAASIAFGQKGNEPTDPTAYAVSQGFSLSTERELGSITLRAVRGTSGGVDTSGNSLPEDATRIMVVEILEDRDGVPGGETLGSASVPAGSFRAFNDFEVVPTDDDMGDLVISFPGLRLPSGSYHIIFKEDGEEDSGGRFWILADINGTFPVGPAAWNSSRPISASTWRVLSGQIQLTINLKEEELE